MNLVVHHVLQTLVIGRAKEDLCVEFPTSEAVVQDLVASLVVAILSEEVRYLLYVDSIIEGCGISDLSFIGRHLWYDI